MIGERETHIRKLRVISANRDVLSLKLRLAGALSAADLHPPSLPRAAIACVRKLRDPAVVPLRFEGGNAHAPREWEHAAVAALDQLVRRAARPALGSVPINSDAVVFLDRSELLACFASDWLDGGAATRWWWRSLFRTTDSAALVSAWMEAPEYAPAALALLARRREAALFISSLGEGPAQSLLSAITRRFALRELAAAIDVVLNESGSNEPIFVMSTGRQLQREQVTLHRPECEPWRPWVDETEELQGSRPQEALLATGLMLFRAPAIVRSRSFARALVEWYRTADGTSLRAYAGARSEVEHELEMNVARRVIVQSDSASNVTSHALNVNEDSAVTPLESAKPTAPHLSETIRARTGAFNRQPVSPANEIETSKPSSQAMPQPVFHPLARAFEQTVPSTLEQTTQLSSAVKPVDVMFDAQIETAFGGVFYLINVGLFLNLYGDFTTPMQPGIDLSIWDFVALIGLRLSGGKLESDPLWPLLAKLAGRANDEEPGAEFDPPDSWRLTDEWLVPFSDEGFCQFDISGDRLRVWRPEGFLILDEPVEPDPEQQLRRESRGFKGGSRLVSRSEPPDTGENPSKLDRWLSWLTPYLRARLALAFGIAKPDEIQQVLLEERARVTVTTTHVDVSFSLEEHPVEIRLAGLDRDPGWVPAAGRYIAFHYD